MRYYFDFVSKFQVIFDYRFMYDVNLLQTNELHHRLEVVFRNITCRRFKLLKLNYTLQTAENQDYKAVQSPNWHSII